MVRVIAVALLSLAGLSAPALAFGQSPTTEPQACALADGVYTCDKAAFARELRHARTVSVQPEPRDHASRRALNQLVRALGKAPGGDASDLTFTIVRTERTIYIGSADTELATLRVYYGGQAQPDPDAAGAQQAARGPLLWVESYSGQPDMPWPAVVHELVTKFQNDFAPTR